MAPREATNSFPDQYLTIEYDASVGPIGMPHDHNATNNNGTNGTGINNENGAIDEEPPNHPENDGPAGDNDEPQEHLPPPIEVALPANTLNRLTNRLARRRHERANANNPTPHGNHHTTPLHPNGPIEQVHSLERITQIPSINSDTSHLDVDPLAIDMTDPD